MARLPGSYLRGDKARSKKRRLEVADGTPARLLFARRQDPQQKKKTRGRRWHACQALICAATRPAANKQERGRRWHACQALICAATRPAAKKEDSRSQMARLPGSYLRGDKTRSKKRRLEVADGTPARLLFARRQDPQQINKNEVADGTPARLLFARRQGPQQKKKTRGRRWHACQALICAATRPAAKKEDSRSQM